MMEMSEEEFQMRLKQAANAGAHEVLKEIGLSDASAAQDIREIKGLLDAWRMVKRTAVKEAVGWFVKVTITAFLLGIAALVGFNFNIGGK